MPELNPAQAVAVAHHEGPLVVFAGAGSGKTRVITYRIANLLAEHGVPPYRILAVTFTNKAAGEMRERLMRLVGEEVARDLWLGTFHAICAKLLRRYGEEIGLSPRFVIYDTSDQKALVTRVLRNLGVDERELAPKKALGVIHNHKREGRGPGDLSHSRDRLLAEVFAQYETALRLADAVDFEDLILRVMRLVEDPHSEAGREIRAKFSHVLVDEFQDTNTSQCRLLRPLVAAHGNLCVVGDDDQSIYRWRGADVRKIREFRRDFPDATLVKLEQNYRSSGHIVRAALGVIERSREREPKRLFTEQPAGEAVRVRLVSSERAEAEFVAESVRHAVRGGLDASEIAVFYRIHAQSRVLEDAMRRLGVAYQVIGGLKFFERAEIKDVLGYLRLTDNPRSDADFLRVVNTPTRGIGDKTVAQLLEVAAARELCLSDALEVVLAEGELPAGTLKKLAVFRDLMARLGASAREQAPRELAETVLEESGYRQALLADDSLESEARLENLAEFLGSLGEFEQGAEERGEPATLSAYLERAALVSDVDGMEPAAKVSLMTIHAAKGLEFESVFLTGMEEGVFPYRGTDEADAGAREELEEERRLAYVAMTRAKKQLVLSHAQLRTLFGTTRSQRPSRFLSDIPSECQKQEGLGAGSRASLRANPLGTYGSLGLSPRPAASPPSLERVVDRSAFDDVAPSERAPRPGDVVHHQKFGRGVVQSVAAGGGEPTIVAAFKTAGVKAVKARWLRF